MSEHNIYYAFCKWPDRESVENWTPLYNDMVVDGAKRTCDAFGRFLGEPYFGHERPIAFEESIGSDARYYCFITSDSEVIVYKETGMTVSSDGGGAEWGGIGGTLSNQSDLQSALDAKADSSALTHYAPKADSLAGYGITDAYTKDETDAKVSSVYRYKGSVATYAELPTEGNTVGDVWNVTAADEGHGIKAGDNVAWTGSAWDALSGEVDLTPFALKKEAGTDHNHDDKYLSLENGGLVLNDVQVGTTPSNAWIKLTRSGGIEGGYNCKTKGTNSLAIGHGVVCNAHVTWAFGEMMTIPYGPTYCLVVGYGHVLKTTNQYQAFFGKVADTDNDAPLVVGNGTVDSPSNAFEARANGDAYVQGNVLEGGVPLSDKYAAKSHTHAMGDIAGLPASGGTAGQVLTKTDTGAEWADAPSSSWGYISGDLANQTDLVAALARKRDSELAIESASGTALAVLPGKAYKWTLSGNGTLSLGDGWTAGSLSDSVVLLSPGSYSVRCSGNLTMVDSLQAGKMNLCVVRWLGDKARLYVVDSEQLGTITAQPVTASGTVGTAMSVNLADYVTVSTGANASYAMASGSSLPSGLSLSSEGVLSGTPDAESTDSLTVDVTADGCTPTTLALTMAITAASTAKDLGTWDVEYSVGGNVNSNISGKYTATEETVATSYGTFPVYSNGKYKIFPLKTSYSQTLTSVHWAIGTEVVADSTLSTLYCAANLVWSSLSSSSVDYVHVRFNNTGSSGTGPYVSVSTSGYSANAIAPSYMYDGNYYLHSGSATRTDAVWKLDSPVAECYICKIGQYSAWSVLRDPATPSTMVNELVNNYYTGVSYTSTDGINVALANPVTYNGCTSQYHAS